MDTAMQRAAAEYPWTVHGVFETAQHWAGAHGNTRMMLEQYACFQNEDRVFEGGDDKDFVVAVPLSGGLDSSTAFAMAVTAGMPVAPYFIDTGAAYADVEYETAQAVCEALTGQRNVQRIWLPVDYKKWDYVDASRNAIIVWAVANAINDRGLWGEIWFGNNAQWRESQQTGSDKCARFFADMQALLYQHDMDVRLVNPLQGMEGGDIVTWWQGRDMLPTAMLSRSCYHPDHPRGCGECRSCFFRAVAFAQAGHNILPTYATWKPGEFLAELHEHENSDMSTGPERSSRLRTAIRTLTAWRWIVS